MNGGGGSYSALPLEWKDVLVVYGDYSHDGRRRKVEVAMTRHSLMRYLRRIWLYMPDESICRRKPRRYRAFKQEWRIRWRSKG